MTHRHPLQHCDLIPNLQSSGLSEPIPSASSPNLNLVNKSVARNYHVFATRHQPLIDNLGRIVPARIDVHTFLHDRIGASS